MTTAPHLVVAGHPDLSARLRSTGRFPAVFDVASAGELRELSRSGRVRSPAAFMFAPGFDEDLPDAGVPRLADGLAASGFTVVVHSFFSERGDRFGPGVIATAEPMSMSDLLETLGATDPVSLAPPDPHAEQNLRPEDDLQPEPPPEPWIFPGTAPAEPAGPPPAPPSPSPPPPPPPPPPPTIIDEAAPDPGLTSDGSAGEQESPEPPPPYGDEREPAAGEAVPPPDMESLLGLPWQGAAAEPVAADWGPEAMPATPHAASPARGGRRRPLLLALLALVVAGAGIGAAGLLGGDWTSGRRTRAESPPTPSPRAPSPSVPSPVAPSRTPSPQAKPAQLPTSSPTAVQPDKKYAPGRLRIVDGRISIEVTWQDRTGGRATYYVVGGPTGRPPSTLASAPPGSTKVTVSALNPGVDYCLTVVAVVDVDRVARGAPVCTHRVERGG